MNLAIKVASLVLSHIKSAIDDRTQGGLGEVNGELTKETTMKFWHIVMLVLGLWLLITLWAAKSIDDSIAPCMAQGHTDFYCLGQELWH